MGRKHVPKEACTLDMAICKDNLNVVINRNSKGVIAELYSGEHFTDLSKPMKDLASNTKIKNKKLFCASMNPSVIGALDGLCQLYAQNANYKFVPVGISFDDSDKDILTRFVVQKNGQIMIHPSYGPRHLGYKPQFDKIMGTKSSLFDNQTVVVFHAEAPCARYNGHFEKTVKEGCELLNRIIYLAR